MHRQPHTLRSTESLQLVYTDVCGPMQTHSFGVSWYFITFTDDYSQYSWSYFITCVSELFEKLKMIKARAEK